MPSSNPGRPASCRSTGRLSWKVRWWPWPGIAAAAATAGTCWSTGCAAPSRRVRSTRRRQDVADLPRLPAEDRELILSRISQIRDAIEAAPKPLAWQLRDKVGTRLRWYEEVEEVDR